MMTSLRTFTAAAGAALLASTAAGAAEPMAVNPTQDPVAVTQSQTMTYDSSTMSDEAAAAAEAGVNASALAPTMDQAPGTVSVQTVTNGPVPDTAENRARFGGPNSRTGRMTAPRGN